MNKITMSFLKKIKNKNKVRKFKNPFFDISFNLIYNIINIYVRTGFDLDPTQEWIQAHVAQTMNL